MLPKATLPNGVIALGAFLLPCLLCLPRNQFATLLVMILASIAILWVGQYKVLAERFLQQHPKCRAAMIVGCSFLFAGLAIGPNVSAKWASMDDHEIAFVLGEDHQLSWSEMVTGLADHPEVGKIGTSPRVRPAYYIIRYLETWLWGENHVLWYGARVLALGAVVCVAWHLLWRWLGAVDSGLMLMFVFVLRMWADLWARIGSSECYAMIGMALCAASVLGIERNRRGMVALSWVGVVAGSVVAFGSKENFLFLVPAVVVYASVLAYRGRLTLSGIVGTLLVVVVGGFIAVKVVTSLAGNEGVDIYNNQRGIEPMLWATVRCLTMHFGAFMLAAIIGLVVWMQKIRQDGRLKVMVPRIRSTVIALAAMLAMFVSQFAFYDGFPSIHNRYAFPAALAPLLTIPLLVQLWLHYRRVRGDSRLAIRKLENRFRFSMVAFVCVMGIAMQRRSARNAEHTTRYTAEVQKVASEGIAAPDQPIVFVCYSPGDYETLYSVQRFIRYYGAKNPCYLQVVQAAADTERDPFLDFLNERLTKASQEGDEAFQPWSELTSDQPKLQIGFSALTSLPNYVGTFSD